MNINDSEKFAKELMPLGYRKTSNVESADLIIVNTCSIREKAQEKAFSFLGRLSTLKKKKPELIIAMGGCVAQQEGQNVVKRVPHIDLVFGTHAVRRLANHIQTIEKEGTRIVDIEMFNTIYEPESFIHPTEKKEATRFVTIMQGCDNFCTYCVVPYTRGRESSRDPENIIQEIRSLVRSGVKEVTLLGQNVNSYGKKEGLCPFSELLARVNAIEGLMRIRFATSHPKDLSDDLIEAFQDLEKLCRHIHLPVQSGSNQVLKRMNRKYTRETYLEKVEKLRRICPDIALSSDMIVGFPGETRQDFEETLDLVKTVEFDGLFAFAYSDRPNAPAAAFSDKISEQEKKQRLQELLELQERFTLKKNQSRVGITEMILVEGNSKKQNRSAAEDTSSDETHEVQWTGRTSDNKIVNFTHSNPENGHKIDTGEMVKVKIEKAFPHSLWGIPVI